MKSTLISLLFLGTTALSLAQTPSYDTDRGFIHPGGLHTQADFDRIKAQLADGNPTVKAAYQKLVNAAYAQANVSTSPTEMVIRGGSGENYMNAARGATMAYQNALRWKIAGTKANADAAVRILMAWARTTKGIGGDSNSFLASGIYGYAFAQAAELMRNYEGWSREEFAEFQRWMLTVWYPKALDFLRRRNGSWENGGTWWQAPGHYWSNWSLSNLLTVISIGILCDDVFIYNQGMSYFKYDQCGTFNDPRTLHEVTGHGELDGREAIWNDGLTDFLGNCVVTCVKSELETGAYGCLGQMNESGRDAGHSAMALGLAVDVAKVGWNQGDDLFAYMDHRLAAGIEFVAGQTQSVQDLPWTDYLYIDRGYAYTDSRSWLMTEPVMGTHIRPYWGTVIGIYEGVKGVRMPFSEKAYEQMGIDEGAQGATSGGYDHMGYSVLMNTRDEQLCPTDKVPTELSPLMEYSGSISANLIPSLSQEKTRGLVNGKTIKHNELGGLVNTYSTNNKTCLPVGQTVKLMPQLPEGEEDTGLWKWNTGETTRDITVTTDRSYIYRVTYTNARGIESQLCFSIAATTDCIPDQLNPTVTVGTDVIESTTARVLYGKTATLKATSPAGWGTWKWTGNKTTQDLTTAALRKTTDYTVEYTNQGGAVTTLTFHLDVLAAEPFAMSGDKKLKLIEEDANPIGDKFLAPRSSVTVATGSDLKLGLTLPSTVRAAKVTWDTGETGDTLFITNIQESRTYVATFTLASEEVQMAFDVLVKPADKSLIEPGLYLLRHVLTDTYLTAQPKNQPATFEPFATEGSAQLWWVDRNSSPKYSFVSLADADSLKLNQAGKMATSAFFPFYIDQAVGTDRIAIHTSASATPKYLDVTDGLIEVTSATALTQFPFQLIPYQEGLGIRPTPGEVESLKLKVESGADAMYDLSGRRVKSSRVQEVKEFRFQRGSGSEAGMRGLGVQEPKGIYIINGKKVVLR